VTLTLDLRPMTLTFNGIRAVVKLHVRAKYHQVKCSGSWVIVLTNLFALSRNGKESENSVLWPRPLVYDLETLWAPIGCQGTCSCKVSSSCVQRFMSYRANRVKNRTKTIQSVATTRTVKTEGRWMETTRQVIERRRELLQASSDLWQIVHPGDI